MFNEKVATFGKNGSLVGIVSEPKKINQEKPAVIVLNSGLVHRSGPFRMATNLCRSLGDAGYVSMRFDTSGIGDSSNSDSNEEYEKQLILDVGEAIKYLKGSSGAKKIVLFGICTGADNAHKVAVQYTDVVGSIFVDGYAYKTWQFYLRRYLPIFTSFKRFCKAILNIALAIVNKVVSLFKKSNKEAVERGYFTWRLPEKSKTIGEWQGLVNRKVELLYFFTAGSNRYCNYPLQFQDALPTVQFNNQLSIQFVQECDHTFILQHDQQLLFSEIRTWLVERF